MAKFDLPASFAAQTGYTFKNPDLLTLALTHSSQAHGPDNHNERLEFLGDRVLALVIAEELFSRFPDSPEGEMARRLNAMVRKETCATVATRLELGEAMKELAGSGAANKHIFSNRNVLGDACEAVLAAVYLDGGMKSARTLIISLWDELLNQDRSAQKDPKSALQEWVLARGNEVPVYTEISRQGPDHQPEFVMQVKVTGFDTQTGKATSKRAAEQGAARAFMAANNIEF